jgi:hypothetical protein
MRAVQLNASPWLTWRGPVGLVIKRMEDPVAVADIDVMAAGDGRSNWNLGSRALAVVVVVLAALVVFGLIRHGSTQRAAGGSSMGPANRPLPPGEWEATGTVVKGQSAQFTNEPIGTVLHRPWSFETVCKGTCQIVFLRQTLYGPSATELIAAGSDRYTASFPPVRVPCAYTATYSGPRRPFGESHDYYVLYGDPGGSELTATEQQVQTGCYPGTEPPGLTRWHAVRSPQV